MFVICVIIAVFGYIIYTVFKIKIEEWLEEAKYVTIHVITYTIFEVILICCFVSANFYIHFMMTSYEFY